MLWYAYLVLGFQLNLLQCNKVIGCTLYQGLVNGPIGTLADLLGFYVLVHLTRFLPPN